MFTECITLSFDANFSPFSLAKSPPHNLQIIAYIMVCLNARCYPTVFGCKLYSAHVWMKPRFLLLEITLAWKWQIASLTFQRVICDRTIIKTINSVIAKYRDLSVSQISRYFAQPCPIIVNYFQKVEYHKCCTTWSFSGLNCLYFQTFSLNKTNLDREQTLPSMKGFPQPQKSPRKEFCHTHLQQDQLLRMGCFLFLWLYSNCNITELLVALNDSCVCSHTCQEECFALDNTVKW